MRYWWVNQNKTYRHEFQGGYLWSPKRKRNGARNPFYDSMREVAPGDVVFSFAGTYIKAIGIAQSNAYEAPKPIEFGAAGAYWNLIGWRVDVRFEELQHRVSPGKHMDVLGPRMPARYAPLHQSGRGLESVYLAELPEPFATALAELIGPEARNMLMARRLSGVPDMQPAVGLAQWEAHQMQEVIEDRSISDTERQAVVLARRGQGAFRRNVQQVEGGAICRVTRVDQAEHLRASHCKPWRDSNNVERLDGENGLLLTPDVDHLFDRGFISFEANGRVLVSPVASDVALARMGLGGIRAMNVGSFSEGQRRFLEHHRESVFLESRLKR